MKQFLTYAFILLFTGASFAQNEDQDPKAKAILDKVSKEMKSYKTIAIDFKMTIKGTRNETTSGNAGIKGEKYFFHTDQEKTWNNGTNHWSLEDGDDICYKSEVTEGEDAINPKEILTIWEKGFKYKYLEATAKDHKIKLFPMNPGKSKYHTVTLLINKTSNKVSQISIKTKDGMTITLSISKFTPNIDLSDSKFSFSTAKHPGVEVEEL